MVRIKDIAEAVGVSTTTVSNVIHDKEQRVSPETRARIQQAVLDMGYVPNMSALMLAQNYSGIMGVVLLNKDDDRKPALADPYYSTLVGYLEEQIKKSGHYMLMITVPEVEEIHRQVLTWKLEGLVVCNLDTAFLMELHERCQCPIVSIDTYMNRKNNFINIMTDDFGGGYKMGCYLRGMGHRRAAMIADNDQGVDHYRWMGFQKAFREAGVVLTEEQHILIPVEYQHRQEVYEELFQRLREYTVLFYASDYYALEGCSFLRDKGIRIPEDISVTGFDDLVYAKLAKPRLTTMHQNIEKKACMAVDALLHLLKKDTNTDYLLQVDLIERESVQKVNE
ncbi:MAG: LacI family DNA-binding transcriptional regulator [Lachnospiraceae bacterium]|nr:LacI family DNA-binding transcriptional regulator [Lachnospiraceae bacterium]